MITETEIETYAVQIAESDFDMARGAENLIGHLYGEDFIAVMRRASEIARNVVATARAEANALENLERLAKATGCPEAKPMIPWLQERGLIEKVDGLWRLWIAKPAAVSQE